MAAAPEAGSTRTIGLGAYEQLDPPPATGLARLKASRCLQCLLVAVLVAVGLAAYFWYDCHYLSEPWFSRTPNGDGLPQKYFGGRPTLNYWDLPYERPEEQLDECLNDLDNITVFAGAYWGYADAAEAARLSYKCTKVAGLFEQVPEKLRGVFWMKGNGFPEILATLQMGQWFEDERVFVSPFAPFMWSWPDSMPKHAPYLGLGYKPTAMKMLPYVMSLQLSSAFSFKFGVCPAGRALPFPLGMPGHACEAGSGEAPDMTYAVLQLHQHGRVNSHRERELYTMEEDPSGVQPGARWHRGIYGAPPVFGRCSCVSLGSYELVKVIDADGEPLEPYYSEYIEFIGEVRQLFWAGWADELAKNLTEADHFGPAWHRVLHLWCEEADHPEPFCPGGSREAPDVAEFRRRVDNEFPDMAMS